jgi:hypothetical protein
MKATYRNKEDRIFQIIDRELKQAFGEESARLVYNYLESRYSLSQSEFGARINLFAEGMEKLLSAGAYVVESKILDSIYSEYATLRRAKLERQPEECGFACQIRTFMLEK